MSKLLVTAGWAHVPHLDEEAKARLLEAFPLHERAARTEGVPLLGSGLVFPVEEESIVCAPFAIPAYFRRINGLDFGYDHPTGGAGLAIDLDSDCVYVVSEFRARLEAALPVMTATAMKAWGTWIPTSWPHDGLQHDKGSGEELAGQYRKHGLNMLKDKATHAAGRGEQEGSGGNGVEAGLQDMYERMLTGRWKVFSTCVQWLEERRTYHRKNGQIVKLRDDLISASRYAYMMRRFAKTRPVEQQQRSQGYRPTDRGTGPLG